LSVYITRSIETGIEIELVDNKNINRLKRLRFRAWHRGIKEMDLILGQFADAALESLSPDELDQFEVLLEVGDQQFYRWVNGAEEVPAAQDSALLRRIIGLDHMTGLR